MRPRLTFFAVLSLSLVALAAVDGCSRQGEGERCDQTANGNADCDDGLTCVPYYRLQGGNDKTDRCCANPSSNALCTPGTPSGIDTGTAGSGGGSGSSGSAGAAGSSGSSGSSSGSSGGPDGGGQAGAP